ncbi:acetyltransferase [Paramecium bursaria Chlorella virus NE-JV-1]|nr:acetyltransferase [Paramecium bursaria Chlorella virus NE-JV-1]
MFRLASKDLPRAMAFTARTFVASEPTSVALKLTTCDFVTAFQDVMQKAVESGYSFAVENEQKNIVAQSLSVPYATFASANYGHTRETAPMFDLFSHLDSYEPHENTIVVFAISSEIKGRGLASALLARTIEQASRDGYSSVLADCTNFKSQKLFAKYGFLKRVEINYKNFEYGVTKPFESIVDTRGIQRMTLSVV